jgi:hypothetical protein
MCRESEGEQLQIVYKITSNKEAGEGTISLFPHYYTIYVHIEY